MTDSGVLELAQRSIAVTLMLCAPILGFGLVVGLIVSVFQAATQINDASLSFIPKVIAVFATFVIAGPWMLTVMIDYMRRVLTGLPGIIG